MNLSSDEEILAAVKAEAAKFNLSVSYFIGLGSAIAKWQTYALIPNFGPAPHTIDESEITQETLDEWPEWVADLAPAGSKWERLHWPDGSITIRLVTNKALVLAAKRLAVEKDT